MNAFTRRKFTITLLSSACVPGAAASAAPKLVLHGKSRRVPSLFFLDGAGRQLSLEDFRSKLLLLNLWATWCTPCRKEMPSLERLQTRLGGPKFEVLALSMDSGGIESVRKFFAQTGVTHLNLLSDQTGRAVREVGGYGLPLTLLIDREGRELARVIGPAEWDSEEIVSLLSAMIDAP